MWTKTELDKCYRTSGLYPKQVEGCSDV